MAGVSARPLLLSLRSCFRASRSAPRRTRPSRERPPSSRKGGSQEADQQAQLALSDPETRAAPVRAGCHSPSAEPPRGRRPAARGSHPAGAAPPRCPAEPRPGLHASREGQSGPLPLFRRVLELDPSNATARMALARAETEKGNYARSLELARPALAAFEQSPEGLLILATDFLKTGTGPRPPRWSRTWKRLPDVPPAASVQLRPAARRRAASSRRASIVLEHCPARPTLPRTSWPSPSAARTCATAIRRGPSRPTTWPSASGRQSVPALRQAAAVAERHGELERSLSYLDASEEARAGRSGDPPGLRPRLPQDGPPGRRRGGARPRRRPPPGRARVPVHPRRREGGEAAVRGSPGPARAARPEAAGGCAASVRAGVRAIHAGDTSKKPPCVSGRASGCSPSSWRPATTSRWWPGTRVATRRPIEGLEELLRRHPDHAPSCEVLGGLLIGQQRYAEAETLLEEGGPAQPGVDEGQLPARPAPGAHGPEGGSGTPARPGEVRFARRTNARRGCSFGCWSPTYEGAPSPRRTARPARTLPRLDAGGRRAGGGSGIPPL